MEVILVEDLKKLNIILSFDSPHLKTVVLMNETSEKIPEKEGIKGLGLCSSENFEELRNFIRLSFVLNRKSRSMERSPFSCRRTKYCRA